MVFLNIWNFEQIALLGRRLTANECYLGALIRAQCLADDAACVRITFFRDRTGVDDHDVRRIAKIDNIVAAFSKAAFLCDLAKDPHPQIS